MTARSISLSGPALSDAAEPNRYTARIPREWRKTSPSSAISDGRKDRFPLLISTSLSPFTIREPPKGATDPPPLR